MGSSTLSTLDKRINGAIPDGPNVLHDITKLQLGKDDIIEISSELPAYPDADIILGYITRWRDIYNVFHRDIRVYAWSYTTDVEKYILGCTQHMSHIHVTVLPAYLKEKKHYAF